MNDIFGALGKLIVAIGTLMANTVRMTSRLLALAIVDPLTILVIKLARGVDAMARALGGNRESTENEKVIGCILVPLVLIFSCYMCRAFFASR